MADYAGALGVTPTHLTRVCRAASGKTAAEIITERKLYEARVMLGQAEPPISGVAEALGFHSYRVFHPLRPEPYRSDAIVAAKARPDHGTGMMRLHPSIPALGMEYRSGQLSRREFLTRATALGASAAALGALGLPRPLAAQDAPRRASGGTLRIQQDVRALKDPRTMDWPEIANVTRGWLEYLVEYQRDGSVRGMLLENWEVNADATEYLLKVRPGVRWSDGTEFSAQDVARMFAYWCEPEVPGNVMAASLSSLSDPETGGLRDGAVEIVDPMRVRLRPGSPDVTLIVALADYPAAVIPPGFTPETMLENPVGTGPYRPELISTGERAILVSARISTGGGPRSKGSGRQRSSGSSSSISAPIRPLGLQRSRTTGSICSTRMWAVS